LLESLLDAAVAQLLLQAQPVLLVLLAPLAPLAAKL